MFYKNKEVEQARNFCHIELKCNINGNMIQGAAL